MSLKLYNGAKISLVIQKNVLHYRGFKCDIKRLYFSVGCCGGKHWQWKVYIPQVLPAVSNCPGIARTCGIVDECCWQGSQCTGQLMAHYECYLFVSLFICESVYL